MNNNKQKDQQIADLKASLMSTNTALSAATSSNNTPRLSPAVDHRPVESVKQDHQASPELIEENNTATTSTNNNEGLIDFTGVDQNNKLSQPMAVPVPETSTTADLISFIDFGTPSTANVSIVKHVAQHTYASIYIVANVNNFIIFASAIDGLWSVLGSATRL